MLRQLAQGGHHALDERETGRGRANPRADGVLVRPFGDERVDHAGCDAAHRVPAGLAEFVAESA